MKRFFAIIFTFYYLTLSIGLAISIHSCEGEVYSVGIFDKAVSCCEEDGSCCNCCEDDQYLIQAKTSEQLTVTKQYSFLEDEGFLLNFFIQSIATSEDDESLSDLIIEQSFAETPPIWLINCTLIFYA
ncbi:MAG: hypothetical protein U9N53_11145 [Bacteroidota bacterium]|nr:hypothetical protein [Bacteroidota bacterium]